MYTFEKLLLFSLGTCGRLHHSDAAQHPQQIHARDVGEAAEPGADPGRYQEKSWGWT